VIFDYFQNISFARPWIFGLFLLLPVMIAWYILKRKKSQPFLQVSQLQPQGLGSWKNVLQHFPFIFRLLAISSVIVAMAQPQSVTGQQHAEGEGIDIVLCIDVSGSMTAQDFSPNRLEAAKRVAIDFVSRRPTDRIGIVIFSGESFTLCPVTSDHNVIISAIQNIHNGMLEDGTAIGSGLATSVDRLRSSEAKSKVVLLLTDGENNGGLIDPKTAKEIAKSFSIRVYTIGMASEGYAPQPVNTPTGIAIDRQKIAIDEALLKEIATETGGNYFRARDNQSLSAIYNDIDKMEKSRVEIINTVKYQDKFFPLVLLATFFLLLEIILNYTVLRRFP
jgi:Ca-activated chloride channel family protein